MIAHHSVGGVGARRREVILLGMLSLEIAAAARVWLCKSRTSGETLKWADGRGDGRCSAPLLLPPKPL